MTNLLDVENTTETEREKHVKDIEICRIVISFIFVLSEHSEQRTNQMKWKIENIMETIEIAIMFPNHFRTASMQAICHLNKLKRTKQKKRAKNDGMLEQ